MAWKQARASAGVDGSGVDGAVVKRPGVKGEGDTEFVVPESELWDILSEATDRSSKSSRGQADFRVGTIACLHANHVRRVDALSLRTIYVPFRYLHL